jgi:hypothetical protein
MQIAINTDEQEMEIIALDMVALMAYQTKLNIDALDGNVKKMRPSALKDTVMGFVQNQKNWMDKLMRGMRKIGIDQAMQKDLNSIDLKYYSIICEFARQAHDYPAAADLMEHICAADSIPDDVINKITALLSPLKNKNQL